MMLGVLAAIAVAIMAAYIEVIHIQLAIYCKVLSILSCLVYMHGILEIGILYGSSKL